MSDVRDYVEAHWAGIRRWLAVTVALTLASGVGAYAFLSGRRSYTAEVTLEFVNEAAKDGYASDGSKIDPETGIVAADVLSDAVNRSGVRTTPERVAASLSVEPVVPDDEQDRIDAALKAGDTDYRYVPTRYRVTLTWPDEDAARLMQAVTSSYMEHHADEHVIREALPADPAEVSDGSDDYIPRADALSASEQSIEGYLMSMKEKYGDFRSPTTGYAWEDLYDRVVFVRDVRLARAYSDIMSNRVSRDPEALVRTLRARNAESEADTEDIQDDLDEVVSLIKSYSEKNRADEDSRSSDDSDTRTENGGGASVIEEGGNGTVVGDDGDSNGIDSNRDDVSDWVYKNDARPTTTYDGMIKSYMSERDQIGQNASSVEWNDVIIAAFDGAEATTDEEVTGRVEGELGAIEGDLCDIYGTLVAMRRQQDLVLAGRNLVQLTTPVSVASVDVRLYVAIAMAAAAVLCLFGYPLTHELRKHVSAFIAEEAREDGMPGLGTQKHTDS